MLWYLKGFQNFKHVHQMDTYLTNFSKGRPYISRSDYVVWLSKTPMRPNQQPFEVLKTDTVVNGN